MERYIYMDNAATTRVSNEVMEAMLPYFQDFYGNPSSVYSLGQESKKALNKARKQVADAIGAKPEEIYFTAGGSEADNWAIKGIAKSLKDKGRHIITSKIEHHAVLHTCEDLEKEGYEVTYLNVDEEGFISLKELEDSIRPDTILITIMFANNEIGTIEPVEEIAKIAKEHKVLFHTDAVQAVGHVPISVHEMGIDMLSLSGHKLHAPKGVGALFIRNGLRPANLILGGGQEKGRRAGTENVAGIVGLGRAIEVAVENMDEKITDLSKKRDYLIDKVLSEIEHSRVNGSREKRLPGNCNVCFRFIEGEAMLLALDMLGIAGSSGSACTSGSLDPSHVLLAIGLPHEIAHGSLRLSLDESNTYEEIDFVVENLKKVVERFRSMSPLYEDFIKEGK
ncbi:MAG: cysteine desulfurase NifS [Tissierellia bacterium]|nr:cysteine desulfurase NifS [Tissierellia bacterium]